MRKLTLDAAGTGRGPLLLVNRSHPLRAPAAEELTAVDADHPDILLDRRAAERLAECVRAVGGEESIVPVSGWRSQEEQQQIWDDSLAEHGADFTRQYVAVPGCSEHQTGLAIDVGLKLPEIDFLCPEFPYEGICQEFRLAAPRYGFVERYPAGKEPVTGISHEPWHFRYVGAPHAEVMAERGLVLEEYCEWLKGFPLGGEPLRRRAGGVEYQVFYTQAAPEGETCLEVEEDWRCAVSGDNGGGFVVTLWREAGSERL